MPNEKKEQYENFILELSSTKVLQIVPACWIPFVREIFIAMQKMKEIVKIYRNQLILNELVNKVEAEDAAGGIAEAWSDILDLAQNIEQAKISLESLDMQRKQMKMVSILGDILQGSILIVLLLRPDLRVRSFFNSVSMLRSLGLNQNGLETLGNTDHVHSYFTDSINLNNPFGKPGALK